TPSLSDRTPTAFTTLRRSTHQLYTLSLHDALPIFTEWENGGTPYENPEGYERFNPINHVKDWRVPMLVIHGELDYRIPVSQGIRSEEHTSELQSRENLVCRLVLEKKKRQRTRKTHG